jgi:hypothetical protein
MGLDILIFLGFIKSILNKNSCKLKVTNSKMSMFKANDELIFNEGVLGEKWKDNSMTPYVVASELDIEYFYLLETRLANAATHDNIVTIFNKENIPYFK